MKAITKQWASRLALWLLLTWSIGLSLWNTAESLLRNNRPPWDYYYYDKNNNGAADVAPLMSFILQKTQRSSSSEKVSEHGKQISSNLNEKELTTPQEDLSLSQDYSSSSSSSSSSMNTHDGIQRHFISATLGSNMVLQRDTEAVIWGYSQPGATITSQLYSYKDDETATVAADVHSVPLLTTTANSDGLWRQRLPAQSASLRPQSIHVKSTTGESATLENILFGDVYLCGGQSNMGFALPATINGTQEAMRGNQYPHIRIFTVGKGTRSPNIRMPDLQTVEQPWTIANQESLYQHPETLFGLFSSVCWFFGREIADGLQNQVPIGLVSNNWGGQRIEHFLPQPAGDLYNAMIYPYMVGPMALTGFAWYQGESNTQDQTGDPKSEDDYATLFPNMIQSWRQGFQIPDAYFGFIQLSTWCPPKYPYSVPKLRQAQMKALDSVSGKLAYATNADHGDGCNIHPPAKQYVGKRLGRSALAVQYGHDISWKSPLYNGAVVQQLDKNESSVVAATGVSVVIHLNDVGSQGLYVLDTPYNLQNVDNDFDCQQQIDGTCAGAQILLNNGKGWKDALVSIRYPDQIILTCPDASDDSIVLATSYGWGSVPLLTVYDRETDLPVLPWKETISSAMGFGDGPAPTVHTTTIA